MSNYPSWWNTTLTIYNKYTDPTSREVSWYKHKVTDCFWKYTETELTLGNTNISTNSTICRIPKDENFVEGYIWESLTAEQKATKFTLQRGDIIVRGEVTDSVDEYTAGSRSSDLITKYKNAQGCMVIEYASINIDGGRCLEHYHVKGI